jgi:hypothetical protein
MKLRMSENRRTFEIKRALLKRAIAQGRGPEMILLIQWLSAANAHACEKTARALAEFEIQNYGQPRSVRMLNLLAEVEGASERYFSADVPRVHDAPSGLQ